MSAVLSSDALAAVQEALTATMELPALPTPEQVGRLRALAERAQWKVQFDQRQAAQNAARVRQQHRGVPA